MDAERIAQNVRNIRGDRTQMEMAELLGVTFSAVGNYERGERIPRDETKLKYAEIAGTNVNDIFFDHKDTKRV